MWIIRAGCWYLDEFGNWWTEQKRAARYAYRPCIDENEGRGPSGERPRLVKLVSKKSRGRALMARRSY